MRQLMISLDKKIMEKDSTVARRMIEYGKTAELFILIPASEKKEMQLSNTVHIFSTGGNKLQQLFRLKKMGLELIEKNDIKFITTQDPFFLGKIGWWLKKKTGATLEVQVHGDFFSGNYYRFQSGLMNHLRWHIGKFVVRRADKVRVVGERVKQSVLRLGVPEAKIAVRPVPFSLDYIGIDYSPFKESEIQTVYPGYEKIFVFLGRFDPVKNIAWLIDVFNEAIKKNPRLLLLVVGDGVLSDKLVKKIGSANKNIQLKHWEVLPISYYQVADCIVIPSLSEGYGLVPMEAHYLNKPIIMNDVGVANYELKPSDKVKILPINDREAWIKAILSV